MKHKHLITSHLMVALITATGVYIGTTTTGHLINHHNQLDDYRNAKQVHKSYKPSPRAIRQDYNIHRDVGTMMRQQSRRMAILQENQELMHAAAAEEEDKQSFSARERYRAYRICRRRGYTNPRRLSYCIEATLEFGEFSPLDM